MANPIAQNNKTIELTFAEGKGVRLRIRATLMNLGEKIEIEVLSVHFFDPNKGERELGIGKVGNHVVGELNIRRDCDVEVVNG